MEDGRYGGKRTFFGTDSERYLASLFQMRVNSRGSRLPDLITDYTKKQYSPEIAMEIKSGRKRGGGKLLAEQFVYAISTREQYEEFMGEEFSGLEGWFEGGSPFREKPYLLFYNNIQRLDDLKCDNLDRHFSAIKMVWGDQFIVPSNVILAFYLARMKAKDGVDLPEGLEYIRKWTKKRIASESSLSMNRNSRKEDFQNFEWVYSEAIYNRTHEENLSTDYQKQVLDDLYAQLPDLDSYPRRTFVGPNKTTINVIVPKGHGKILTQLGESIEERRPLLTELTKERRANLDYLKNISPMDESKLPFCNGGTNHDERKILRGRLSNNLSTEQIDLLERLAQWKTPEDITREKELPEVKDDIPF